jgi:hypothetical protein
MPVIDDVAPAPTGNNATDRETIDREWTVRIIVYVRRLQHMIERFADDAETLDFHELEGEEYAPVFKRFDALCRMGVRFDDSFVERIKGLRAGCVAGELDDDADISDARINYNDDSDVDLVFSERFQQHRRKRGVTTG